MGPRDEAAEIPAGFQRRPRTDYAPTYFHALVHRGLGETDEALGGLEKAATPSDSMIRDLLVDVPLEGVRSGSSFRELLGKINLVGVLDRPVDPPR